jgi:nitronate monooxygenase
MTWPDKRLLDLLGLDLPIIQAPMAGLAGSAVAAAVAQAGGLGSLGCATLSPDQVRAEFEAIRRRTSKPINLNFFCHMPPAMDVPRQIAWQRRLSSYHAELGLDPDTRVAAPAIAPFGDVHCDLVTELKPEVVSFHFGLPSEHFLIRVKAVGAKVLSSATTVKEALWLEQRGCDAIIAQGSEAGGHRGMFLTEDVAAQAGTMALLPQVADVVRIPVIAAGGVADGRGIAAAFALGASGVQIGTAYLFCPESDVPVLYRRALSTVRDDATVVTNVLTGRPARAMINRVIREIGPMAENVPAFPLAGAALAPLRSKSEKEGREDFTPLWCGQGAGLGRALPAGELTVLLAEEALAKLGAWPSPSTRT